MDLAISSSTPQSVFIEQECVLNSMADLIFPTNCRQHLKDLKCFDFAERDKFMKRSLLERIQFRFYTWHFSNRVMVTYNFLSEVIFVLVLVLYARAANSARNVRAFLQRQIFFNAAQNVAHRLALFAALLYASTAASSYQWTFFDSFIFYLFLLVTLSKVSVFFYFQA